MMQYEYRIVNKRNSSWHLVCATAKNEEIARNQIAKAYSDFIVDEEPMNEYPPHYFLSEIDCSMCDINDVEVAA